MRTWQKLTIVIVSLALYALPLTACQRLGGQRPQAAGEMRMASVQRGTMVKAIDSTGNISARRDAELSFEVAGRVAQVHVEEGDRVETGQLLAELDTTDLEMEVAKARQSLAINEAQLAKLQTEPTEAELAAAQANLESARENLAKVLEGPSEAELAAAGAALKAAQDSYEDVLDGADEDEITVAKADMEKAKEALKQAQAEYDKFAWRKGFEASPQAAELNRATVDYERARANYRLKIQDPTEAEVQNALAKVQRAQDDLDTLRDSPTEADVANAQAQVAQAESQLDQLVQEATDEEIAINEAQVEQARVSLQQAERRLEKARLVAAFFGTVTAVNCEAGDPVSANQPAISLADLSAYEVEVLVDEVDIAGIASGQRAEITLDAYPDVVIPGTVRSIAPEGTITQGVVNFPVTIDLNMEDLPSGTGVLLKMTANVRIVREVREDVLLVPLEAIHREGATEYVLVPTSSGQPRRVQVATGQIEGDRVEVQGGLREGEQVLLSGGAGSDQPPGGFPMFGGKRP
ncbi:MAG: efflux RND transporter periplasmic adaptor subunit [Chloroflexota bacterium]|nr:efflux RND transporter periplasmic adaptor subunit [Chloroflexota bacterium]